MAAFYGMLREIPKIVKRMKGEAGDELMAMVEDTEKAVAWEEFLAG